MKFTLALAITASYACAVQFGPPSKGGSGFGGPSLASKFGGGGGFGGGAMGGGLGGMMGMGGMGNKFSQKFSSMQGKGFG